MSDFQDELRRLEQASDRIDAEQIQLDAAAARSRAELLAATRALRGIIDSAIAEALTAVPSMRMTHPGGESANQEWELIWKDDSRSLRIQLLEGEGAVWWTWTGHGRSSSIAKRTARDADKTFIEHLIAALANPDSWQRGAYPPVPSW